jgi:hypothetical protein
MLRQNNRHTPARAAVPVLAAVLRTLAALSGGFYCYKNGLKLNLKLGAAIAQRACKDPDTSPPGRHRFPIIIRPIVPCTHQLDCAW